MVPYLVVKQLNKDFESSGESFEVFKDLNFEINSNTSTALIGESGSGKTTLIHLIAGLESPDSGTIKVGDFDIWKYSEQKRANFRLNNISIIFQQYNLIPSLNVLNNIKFHSQLIKNYDQNFRDELINLLGLKKNFPLSIEKRMKRLSEIPGGYIHWYGKSKETIGRKMGHITFLLDQKCYDERSLKSKKIIDEVIRIWPSPYN